MKLSPLLFRRIHKWIGLLLGLQFVIWTISGAMMAVLDMNIVAGGPAPVVAHSPVSTDGKAWPIVRQSLGNKTINGLSLRPLLDGYVFEIATPAGIRLFNAENGAPIAIDAELARRIAQADYAGSGSVKNVELLAEPTLAIREHGQPAWRVDFADAQNSSFYISQSTGKLLERRNDTWRVWDFFWMLHNMDYVNRTSFNHPLIVMVGFGIAWLAMTGLYLLFRTTWRPEMRLLRRRR